MNGFFDDYISGRAAEDNPSTTLTLRQVQADLVAAFGAGTDLRAIGTDDAERLKATYQRNGLAPATVYRRLTMARVFFDHARRMKHVLENPFADVRSENQNNTDRRHYVTRDEIQRLLDAANPTWRTIIALCRFAGLRNPSEALSLRWADANLAAGRMVVASPKTEHLEGTGSRVVPVFPELKPYPEDAYDLAEPGKGFVVGG